jgi:hypothetical protein
MFEVCDYAWGEAIRKNGMDGPSNMFFENRVL